MQASPSISHKARTPGELIERIDGDVTALAADPGSRLATLLRTGLETVSDDALAVEQANLVATSAEMRRLWKGEEVESAGGD